MRIFEEFNMQEIDWSGLEHLKPYLWQKQLHLYEVPFYYIEYAMAQLGAIAVWKRFKEEPAAALEGYKKALSLGYTATIGEIYEAAGIRFDFSSAYIQSLVDFVKAELAKLG
ncbi:MAG: M3 family metallopeptidase [Rufibacter sp.]